ncbi:MAG: GNAT family N-acetyltransferase [Anaerolineaceae bacterium]|nr:GNAT family N-acetyltransferase [Anaerolineaceae bacterium]
MSRLPRKLDQCLILRQAAAEDVERIAAFNARIHLDTPGDVQLAEQLASWTRELADGRHPTASAKTFLVVEDTDTRQIVSSTCLIPQTWSYAGIPFGVGRVELVGTDPAYRQRGLVRAQFELLHQWSESAGDLAQAITGIPYFYRLFGYEMTVNLGGGRQGCPERLPLQAPESEPYQLRAATAADLPFIAETYARAKKRSLLACVRDDDQWRYELGGRPANSMYQRELRVIEDDARQPIGFLSHPPFLWGNGLSATDCELIPGVSWAAVVPVLLRYLWRVGQEYAARDQKECRTVRFNFGEDHPAYRVSERWLTEVNPPYAWYLRVPDWGAFLRHIQPELERRLADSELAGHTGDLTISNYHNGVKIRFNCGKIESIEAWKPDDYASDQADAQLPQQTFLHLLFGHRAIEEIRHLYADCSINAAAKPLMRILFPRLVSEDLWGLV